MNLTHLEYFIAAVESGSYSSASKLLFVDASTISLAISALEAEIGGMLLTRANTGVTPTQLGMNAYDFAKQITLLVQQFQNSASCLAKDSKDSSLCVGVSSDPQRGAIVSARVLKSVNSGEVTFHFDSNHACILGVEKGYLDAALIAGRPEGTQLDSIGLFRNETLALTSRPSDRRIGFDYLKNASIAIPYGYDYLYKAIEQVFSRHSATPRFYEVGWKHEEVLDFLENGKDAVVLIADDPKMKAEYDPRMICHIDKSLGLDIPVYLAWRQECSKSIYAFRNRIIDQCVDDCICSRPS